jgi:RIO kinase 2
VDAKGSTELGGEDTEDEDDALLTKQLNKQRKREMALALGRRQPLTSRNTYKDKREGYHEYQDP